MKIDRYIRDATKWPNEHEIHEVYVSEEKRERDEEYQPDQTVRRRCLDAKSVVGVVSLH